MDVNTGFVIILGLMLFLVHYFTHRIRIGNRKARMRVVSFSAGIFITYFILHLLPALYGVEMDLTRISLVFVLVGFSIFHVVEK